MSIAVPKIKVLDERCKPEKKHYSDAGLDLKAGISEPIQLLEGNTYKIDTGIQIELPIGYLAMVVPRSGLGSKYGLRLANTVGIIDADYRGNIFVNIKVYEPYKLQPYERFAQLIFLHCGLQYEFSDTLSDTVRGAGGFGHTGTHDLDEVAILGEN